MKRRRFQRKHEKKAEAVTARINKEIPMTTISLQVFNDLILEAEEGKVYKEKYNRLIKVMHEYSRIIGELLS